jgi:hypothetical protein
VEELREAPAAEEVAAWRSQPCQAVVGLGRGGWPGHRDGDVLA